MAWLFLSHLTARPDGALRRLARAGSRRARQLLLGRRFVVSLERNREAADRLDMVLKEMLER